MDGQPEHDPRAERSAQPVFHPAVGDADRETLLRHPEVLAALDGYEPAARALHSQGAADSKQIIGILIFLSSCLGLLGLLGLLIAGGPSGGHAALPAIVQQLGLSIAMVLLLCPLALAASLIGGRGARRRQARAAGLAAGLRRHYILPSEDLDEHHGALLARARTAAETIARSQSHARGPAAGAARCAVLPHLVWDVAQELAELTRQRRLIDRLAPDAGPATKAALAPRMAALEKAAVALHERVAALEAHARRVVELDDAQRDLATARTLAAQDPTLDLLSRRTLDAFAAEDIAGLSDQVAAQREQAALEVSEIAESARELTELVTRSLPHDAPPEERERRSLSSTTSVRRRARLARARAAASRPV